MQGVLCAKSFGVMRQRIPLPQRLPQTLAFRVFAHNTDAVRGGTVLFRTLLRFFRRGQESGVIRLFCSSRAFPVTKHMRQLPDQPHRPRRNASRQHGNGNHQVHLHSIRFLQSAPCGTKGGAVASFGDGGTAAGGTAGAEPPPDVSCNCFNCPRREVNSRIRC